MGAVVSHCPSADQLDRLLAEKLDGPERDAVEAHVEDCSACQQQLARRSATPEALSAARADGRLRDGTPEPDELFLDRLRRLQLGAPAAEPDALAPPAADSPLVQRIAQYELIGKLGQGGMGTVFKARHIELGKIVAMKVLPTAQMCEVTVARFKHEGRAIGRLEHPNIVAAHDAGQHQGVHFLVMSLVDGIDLARLVERRGPLPVTDAAEMTRQAAAGLQHAADRGLVHRDVKPSNLMLARDGVVKLLDLGLARSAGDTASETLTAHGVFVGTADYLAPEQWEGPHGADIRADIYSLGCTLYHLLAGQSPFAASQYKTVLAKMQAHQQVPPPPIVRHRPDVPAGLAAVLDRMLAKDPADRFASPAQVAEALRPFTAGSNLMDLLGTDGPTTPAVAVATTPDPARWETPAVMNSDRQPSRAARRRNLPAALAGLCLALVAGVFALPWFQAQLAPEQKPLAVTDARITHYRDKGNSLQGDLTTSAGLVRLNDDVRFHATFNGPAYCYLIAFNPDGTEQLCHPEDAGKGEPTVRPILRKDVRYPAGKHVFILDEAGLEVFVLVVSAKPLPPYAEWRAKAGAPPWEAVRDGGPRRWLFDGTDYTRFPEERGKVEPKGVPSQLVKLCEFFQACKEFDAVRVIAFPVVGDKD